MQMDAMMTLEANMTKAVQALGQLALFPPLSWQSAIKQFLVNCRVGHLRPTDVNMVHLQTSSYPNTWTTTTTTDYSSTISRWLPNHNTLIMTRKKIFRTTVIRKVNRLSR